MNKTGNKIDYSIRIQKNVERKILSDIIRTLNYFNMVNQYRYIGFGSFYYKDFLLLHEKHDIRLGVSIEIDNEGYAKNEDVIFRSIGYLEVLWEKAKSQVISWCNGELLKANNKVSRHILDAFCYDIARCISDEYVEQVKALGNISEEIDFTQNAIYDYKNLESIEEQLKYECSRCLKEKVYKCVSEIVEIDDIDDSESNMIFNSISKNVLSFSSNDYKHFVKGAITNRYIYNKPFGYIEIKFNELINAFDVIKWEKDQNNIIWLDYDSFIDETQLNGLEKSIKLANRGDLIIFSTSMGTEDSHREKSLKDLKHKTNRVINEIHLRDCNEKGIGKIVSKIVSDTIADAIAKKNAERPEEEKEYRVQPVVECVYSDGTLMYTYGVIIYNEDDDTKDRNFPGNSLKGYAWFPRNDKIYRIYVPALTHKEVNAINQLLPQTDIDDIAERYPFIEKKKIRQYVEIWSYYPNFLEADSYV